MGAANAGAVHGKKNLHLGAINGPKAEYQEAFLALVDFLGVVESISINGPGRTFDETLRRQPVP
jgi:hypothetical protein